MTQTDSGTPPKAGTGQSVQSVERTFAVLEVMANNGGVMGISSIAQEVGLPLPTIHRLTQTLVSLGYLHQDAHRHYVLGPRFMRLGEHAANVLTVLARPLLVDLVEQLGENANLARLFGHQVVYLAHVPSTHAMRMFIEVGKRVPVHTTGLGKSIMATLPDAQVRAILDRAGMAAETDQTITDPDRFIEHLALVRERGYAMDDSEHEIGVRCVAVAVPDAPAPIAISVSGPATRMTDATIPDVVERLQTVAQELATKIR